MSLSLTGLLPQSEGWLPKWLLFISTVAYAQVVNCYVSLKYNKEIYNGKPEWVNPLASRLFGTWSLMQATIRLFAAYRLNDPAWYDLTLISFLIPAFHFGSEWFYFGTAKFGRGIMSPVSVTVISIPWLFLQRPFYVK